jgi:hypothetical protein
MLSLRIGASYNAFSTDTWGCGAVLYAMLLGKPPFPANSYNELVGLASRPHVYLRIPDHMPKELATLIRAMLRLDPKQRYSLPQVARTSWFQEDLEATLSRTPGFVPPEGMKSAATALSRRQSPPRNTQIRRRALLRSGCACGLHMIFRRHRARVGTTWHTEDVQNECVNKLHEGPRPWRPSPAVAARHRVRVGFPAARMLLPFYHRAATLEHFYTLFLPAACEGGRFLPNYGHILLQICLFYHFSLPCGRPRSFYHFTEILR